MRFKSRKRKGFTVIEIVVTIVIMSILFAVTAGYSLNVMKEKRVKELQTTALQLESAIKSFYFDKGFKPLDETLDIKNSGTSSQEGKLLEILVEDYELSKEEMSNNLKFPDYNTLTDSNYFSSDVDLGDYIVETEDLSVYYIGKRYSDLDVVAEKIVSKLTFVFDLTAISTIKLETPDGTMGKVLKTIQMNNYLIVGGTGTTPLLKVTVQENKTGSTHKITNLTSKLANTSGISVSELRHVGGNKLLVNYSKDGKLYYETIEVE